MTMRRPPVLATIVVLLAAASLVALGIWQLRRAEWKRGLVERAAAAERMPPIAFPTMPLKESELPLFRHATGVCLKPLGRRAVAGENQAGEGGYAIILACSTGAEGPGMAVEVGWSRNPNARVDWPGGPVSGIIVPDRLSRIRLVAATAPPGLQPSRVPSPESVSRVSPATHRGYAATWFALAAVALLIYGLAAWKRTSNPGARQ